MYDLPGGGIENMETIMVCLERELMEETGSRLLSSRFVDFNEYLCEYTGSTGDVKNSHHIGFYFEVDLEYDTLRIEPDGHDSLGAEFIDISELSNIKISPIAEPMIRKVIEKLV